MLGGQLCLSRGLTFLLTSKPTSGKRETDWAGYERDHVVCLVCTHLVHHCSEQSRKQVSTIDWVKKRALLAQVQEIDSPFFLSKQASHWLFYLIHSFVFGITDICLILKSRSFFFFSFSFPMQSHHRSHTTGGELLSSYLTLSPVSTKRWHLSEYGWGRA